MNPPAGPGAVEVPIHPESNGTASHPVSRMPPQTCGTRILAILLLAFLPAGCGEGTTDRSLASLPAFCQEVLPQVDAYLAEIEPPSGERYGGTAVVGGIGEIAGGMNALVSTDFGANQHQTFVNLMTLLRLNEELEIVPYLAREVEVNDDVTELTFHLRDDIYWHDGTPTTAHDVEFTYLRATDPETTFPNAQYWAYYVGGPEGVEVVDDHTLRIRLEPHAEFLVPWRSMAILPRHLLEEVPPTDLRTHPFGMRCPVGNGPFVFQERGADESWIFRRNPAFPEALGGPPFLERYVYRVIPEMTTLLTELLTGQVDFFIAPSPDQAPRIAGADGVELRDFEFRQVEFVGWNSRRSHLADARVRRALTLGTNRQAIVDGILGGYGQVANSGMPPVHWAYDTTLDDALQHDPDEARRLLDEAGWSEIGDDGIRRNTEGERLEIDLEYNAGNQQRQSVAEVMQSSLRDIGVAVRPRASEYASLLGRVTDPESRDFDGVILGWVADFRVDEHDLFHSNKGDHPYGWAGTEDEELDRLLDAIPLVVDRDEALPVWRDYQARVLELQPYTYLFYARRLAGVNERLRGVELDARGEWVTVSDWWIPEGERTR